MSTQRNLSRLSWLIPFSFLLIFGIFLTNKGISSEEDEGLEEKLAPGDWMFRQRAFPHGKIDKQAFIEAQRARVNLVKQKQNQPISRFNNDWTFAGPTNIGGRVTDVEMPANDTETIYVGTAAGGIFKSEDLGENWAPIFDDALSLAIGDMALAPSDNNTIYVGTGEANGGGGSLAYDGLGVYRSDDAGITWTHKGLEEVGSIGKVVVDPTNKDRVFVAAMGDLFDETPERGVFRTTDGGDDWDQIFFVSQKTGAIDLAIHPTNPDIIYVAMWERTRNPINNTYGGPTSGIYRSVNGGDNWQELKTGLPSTGNQKGRIGLALSPSSPETLYAFYAQSGGHVQGIYKTTDGGDNWTNTNASGIASVPYMWWFGKIFIHPTNPDMLYLSGFDTERSMDGGANWSTVFSNAHVDQHSVFIHPANPDLVVIGNDGGAYGSLDGGASYTKFEGLPITQFYTCEIDYSNPELLLGGTQDNSPMRTQNGGLGDWEIIWGGDGFCTLVDPVDNQFVYTESQYGNFVRSTDGGQSFTNATSGIAGADRANWNTPVVFDPTDPTVLYYGANRLYKSTDRAVSWNAISPDLSNGSGGGSQVYGTITSISVSPLDPNIIFVGTDDGNVWVTFDQGNNWDDISDGIPIRWVTSIAADPEDVNSAYLTTSGYRYNSSKVAHVYKTSDNGSTWQDYSGNLPDVPVNKILVIASNNLVIATDIGVFSSYDQGDTWELLGQGLPNVVITDIDYHPPTQKLVAATYGRSMFTYPIDLNVGVQNPSIATLNSQITPNPSFGYAQLQMKGIEAGNYKIDLLDINGRYLKNIFQGELSEQAFDLSLESVGLSSGVYFLRIRCNEQQQIIKWMISIG